MLNLKFENEADDISDLFYTLYHFFSIQMTLQNLT